MGAAGLIDIKRRIKSVENTKKITKAMGLVATSKLRKVRKELVANKQYKELCEELIKEVVANLSAEYESTYFKEREGEKLYIILTSDTGLCGGYNNNIVLYLKEIMGNNIDNSKVVVVGGKGISYIRKYGLSSFSEFVDISDVPTTNEINKIYNDAIYLYEKGEVAEVNIVYTDFVSPVKQDVKHTRLLPVTKNEGAAKQYIIEPNEDEVFKSTIDMYLKSQLRTCMLSAKASEQGSRMSAMNGATDNANEILQNLNVLYNRIRQTIITQEISEIVGGAEAQK